MRKDPGNLKELRDLLEEFDTVMLITRTPDGLLRARPMAVQDADAIPGWDLWLVTADDSPKVAEIAYEENVCVCALRSRDRAYISISARAEVQRDRAEIERLWKPDWKLWFPEGKDDPSIAIMKLDVVRAEYWEPEGGRLRVLYDMVKAAVTGKAASEELNPPKEV
jgi:general stress protein 26